MLVVAILLSLLFYLLIREQLDQVWLIAICGWGIFAGLGSGLLLGISLVVSRGLKNLANVLELLLNMVQLAARDFDSLRWGESRPTAAELTVAMHHQVLEPCLRIALEKALGWLAKPVFWAYRSSMGRAVNLLAGQMNKGPGEPENEPLQVVTPEQLESALETAAGYQAWVSAALKPAYTAISGFGRLFRYLVVIPLYLICTLCIVVAVIPVIILRFYS